MIYIYIYIGHLHAGTTIQIAFRKTKYPQKYKGSGLEYDRCRMR